MIFCFITIVEGFCDTELTSDINRGIFDWEESFSNTIALTLCSFGPPNAIATRNCPNRLNWTDPDVQFCATTVTLDFQFLNFTKDQVRCLILFSGFVSNLNISG